MRERVPLPADVRFHPTALRGHDVFQYRRVADQRRALLAVGVREAGEEPRFDAAGRAGDWWFGHMAYGYKDRLEALTSRCADGFNWPLTSWFVPRWVLEWDADGVSLHVHAEDRAKGLDFAEELLARADAIDGSQRVAWESPTSKADHLFHAEALLRHIQRGDIYEVNYCIAHEAIDHAFDPFTAFDALLARTDAPFAGFYRMGHRFALCCSPERFIAFDGLHMRGEPMKGTRPRGADAEQDIRLRDELANDPKERSENVMALDVMRNDFSRVSVPGTVRVPELFGVRTHPRVHQLVSVVEAQRAPVFTPFDAVKAAFPPASMTGAPKIRAMQLIDAHEARARSLYSGTMGFFAPDGKADLNVVIRTVLFDRSTGKLAVPTGSALTAKCDPAAEWEECLVKFNSIADGI
ncbi:MAG: anthranilate synthase component I family protein [Flavobacteriales bacterium]|nr:anthranilate synthase component I family protein [Flavobacteriales bacterium]